MNGFKLHYERVLELIFRSSYLILALCTFNTFIYNSSVQPIFVKLTLALGAILIVIRLIKYKKYMKMPCVFLMVLFCISFVVSTIMNREYGFIENGKWVVWTGIQFFALYVCDVERDIKSYNKEFGIVSHIIIGYTTIAALVSLQMLVVTYSKFFRTSEGELLISGFTWGRLWGVYTDPNYGAVLSVVSILLSIVFLMKKRIVFKVIYILCIALNFLYLVFSDSRTGELAFVGGIACLLFFCFRSMWKDKKGFIRYTMIICSIILIGGGSLFGIDTMKKEYNRYLAPAFAKIFVKENGKKVTNQKQTNKQSQVNKQLETNKQKQAKGQLGRKQDLEGDISNGRFELWQSAVEVWKTSPIYGVGYVTFVPYAKEHTPDTYAVNNDIGEYGNMHNSFINILAYQGGLGFVILLVLAGYMVWYVTVPIMRETGGIYLYLSAMLSSVAAVVISMMFLLEGIYTLSPGSFVLWSFSGYMVKYAYEVRKG